MTKDLSINRRFAAASLGLLALVLTASPPTAVAQCDPPERCFDLHLVNGTALARTFTIVPGACYEGTGCCGGNRVLGPVPPGGSATVWIARVQGNDCDGTDGDFAIIPSGFLGRQQGFEFDNEGILWQGVLVNGFHGELSAKNPVDGTYTWTLREVETRLSGPLDERLTMPRNRIARNFGTWDGGIEDRTNVEPQPGKIVADHLEFRRNGFKGMSYTECAFIPYFHAQHLVRLPNKNGRAYFMVSNSDAYVPDEPLKSATARGFISVYQSDSLDPETDLVPNVPGSDGQIVWEHSFELPFSPSGGWNHPCKMEAIGGLVLISMQDWAGGGGCRDGSGRGSEQAILFYDVRDPANPTYWGKMTKSELGIAGDIDDVSLVSIGDEWILYVKDKWWRTKNVSPDIEYWDFGGTGNPEGNQQGQYFNSYELYDRPGELADPKTTFTGMEQVMWGNGEGNDDKDGNGAVSGGEFLRFSHLRFFDANSNRSLFPTATFTKFGHDVDLLRPAPNLWSSGSINSFKPSASARWKDYDACGVSVRGAMPVFYTPLVNYRDEVGGDTSADHIWQIWHPDNVELAAHHPDQLVTNLNDSGPGSLRRAMAYGGNITFAQNLNGGTINLTSGPLMVYLYDVNVDASALPSGIAISLNFNPNVPVFQVVGDRTVSQKGFRILTWVTGDPVGWIAGPAGVGHEKLA